MARYIDAEKAAMTVLCLTRLYDSDYQRGYYAGMDAALEIIAAEPTADVAEVKRGEWISVKDNLPEPNIKVLVSNEAGVVFTAYHSKMGDYWWNDGTLAGYNSPITHWMPLPDAPNCGALNKITP